MPPLYGMKPNMVVHARYLGLLRQGSVSCVFRSDSAIRLPDLVRRI